MEFEMHVVRMRYAGRDSKGEMVSTLDEVLVDVDEEGRVRVRPDGVPLHRMRLVGGSSGWKRLTGIALVPERVYRVKLSVAQVGDSIPLPRDAYNDDLPEPEEVARAEAEADATYRAYRLRLTAARAKAHQQKDPKEDA